MKRTLQKMIKTEGNMVTPLGKISTQQKLFQFRFFHPEYNLKAAADELGISYPAAKMAWSRLKKKHDLSRLCPICFHEAFDGTVCHFCGFEHKDAFQDFSIRPDDHHEIVHRLQPNNGLGTEVDYDKLQRELHLVNSALYLKHYIENADPGPRRYEKMKAQLLQEILEHSLYVEDSDAFTEYVAKIFDQQYYLLKRNYPELFESRNAYKAIKRKVLEILRHNGLL